MKKQIILALICVALFFMPTLSAIPIKTTSIFDQKIQPLADYDGTFIGGYGIIYKENETWQYQYYGYLGGIYKDQNKYRIIYGNIYNLEQQQIGNITILTAYHILIGKIRNMNGGSAPVVGFLFTNEDNLFVGRLMSLFGPAPHIWGKFTPN